MIDAFRHHVANSWCRMMHPAPMWPSHGSYRCRTCWREYPVPWEFDSRKTPPGHTRERLPGASTRLIELEL
jgi:hypothetical protein